MAEQVLEATERFQAMNQKLKMAEMYKERYGRKYNHKVKLGFNANRYCDEELI